MKIAFAYFEKFIEMSGGIEHVCCNLANAMTARGHDVSIVYCYGRSGVPFYPLDATVKLYNLMAGQQKKWKHESLSQCVSGGGKLVREFLRVFDANKARDWNERVKGRMIRGEIQRTMEEIRPDIILSFRYETSNYLLNYAQVRVPVITMFHMDPSFILPKMPAGEIRAIQKSAAAQVLLKRDVAVVKNYCPGAHVVWIPNAVPSYEQEARPGERKKIYTIIHAARLNKAQKRQHLLVEAFARVAADFPDWQVELWGGGNESGASYAEELRRKIREYGLEGRVLLKGESRCIAEEYMKADIFAFPSAYEGFPLAMTEAMSAGLPVVTFRSCGAAAELIEDGVTGLLADDGAAALAQKLRLLMGDRRKRAVMGHAARESMSAFYPKRVWDMWEQLMRETAED